MAYVQTTDIENFLQIDLNGNGDILVTSLIAAIDAVIDKYCNRTWTKAADTDIVEKFDGWDAKLFVKVPNIASVQSLLVGKTPIYAGDPLTEANEDFYIYDNYVRLLTPPSRVPRSTVLTYRTSANTIPADIKQAIIQWVSEIFKASTEAGKQTTSVQVGSVKLTYAPSKETMPDFVKLVLDQHINYVF